MTVEREDEETVVWEAVRTSPAHLGSPPGSILLSQTGSSQCVFVWCVFGFGRSLFCIESLCLSVCKTICQAFLMYFSTDPLCGSF